MVEWTAYEFQNHFCYFSSYLCYCWLYIWRMSLNLHVLKQPGKKLWSHTPVRRAFRSLMKEIHKCQDWRLNLLWQGICMLIWKVSIPFSCTSNNFFYYNFKGKCHALILILKESVIHMWQECWNSDEFKMLIWGELWMLYRSWKLGSLLLFTLQV